MIYKHVSTFAYWLLLLSIHPNLTYVIYHLLYYIPFLLLCHCTLSILMYAHHIIILLSYYYIHIGKLEGGSQKPPENNSIVVYKGSDIDIFIYLIIKDNIGHLLRVPFFGCGGAVMFLFSSTREAAWKVTVCVCCYNIIYVHRHKCSISHNVYRLYCCPLYANFF